MMNGSSIKYIHYSLTRSEEVRLSHEASISVIEPRLTSGEQWPYITNYNICIIDNFIAILSHQLHGSQC